MRGEQVESVEAVETKIWQVGRWECPHCLAPNECGAFEFREGDSVECEACGEAATVEGVYSD